LDGKFPNVFYLKATDPATASIVREARFEVKDRSELRLLLDMPDDEISGHAIYDLEPFLVAKIVDAYRLSFEPGSMPVELHPWHHTDDYPYKIHTNRELMFMLAGTKPLAVFTDDHPSLHGLHTTPEREFEPHVTSGLIIKREEIIPPQPGDPVFKGQRIGMRRVLYALRGQEWRIDAYILLRRTGDKSGWNERFERLEGSLLGYLDWQNDFHIEQYRRHFKPSAQDKKR
jgi:hypothetical protein